MKNFFDSKPYNRNVCLILISIQLFIACKHSDKVIPENQDTNSKNADFYVSTQTSKTGFRKQIYSNGKVEALQKADLRFNGSEQLAKIFVRNGQTVNKGTVLGHLKNDLLKIMLQKAEIEFSKVENKFLEEKIIFGFGKVQNTEIPENILKTIYFKTGYLEAKNNLDNARYQYDQTFLKAPFSGTVANLTFKESNYISAQDTFCTLISHNNLEVVFQVMENEIKNIAINQSITIIPFVNNSKTHKGIITEINPMISKEGLVRIKAKINSDAKSLLDGMNVKIMINNANQDILAVPKEALVLRSDKPVIFTANKGHAKWNYVTIADENSTHYAISEGLKTGDTIITSGNQHLAHDSQIKTNFKKVKS
ncbi:MAG TPA: efflux RND transporter periplasmic adaptor subunit [Flavobacterium sp.]|uniref:efflux RND transporter periplasmic adaptor subunit n=1 Tax=Flavobacterium sp. TaxID=239 RepID=UPI002B66B45E|nr:efflux RND transporter periplasmic adaptor subunit [Flavobacterium sp.]HSD15093.1 efflux RND transporter periplasmic adaptor subunit [Flavobacterium sp.]